MLLVVPPGGFEPPTSGLEGHCSIRAELRGRVTETTASPGNAPV